MSRFKNEEKKRVLRQGKRQVQLQSPSQMVLFTKAICIYCTPSPKYHLLAKHTADAESPPHPRQRQTMLIVCNGHALTILHETNF